MKNQAFTDGAVFAMEEFTKLIDTQRDQIKKAQDVLPWGSDASGVLNSLSNVLVGLKIQFECHLMKELTKK